jgi:hypothetical protein
MILNRPFGLVGSLALVAVVLLSFSGCSDDRGAATSPIVSDPAAMKIAQQAHLWLSFENVESVYVETDSNAWLTDSWVTESSAFDLAVQNNAKFATYDVVLLVTVPSKILAIPGWSVTIGGTTLDASAFTETDPSLAGFGGGSHGVFPPSGNGVYCPVPLTGVLAKKSSISVPVTVSSGGVPGFLLHFDVGSSALYNPASHDATVNAPDGPPPPPPLTGACCLADWSCVELTQANCALQGGTYHGDESLCTPDLCTPPPAPGACCSVTGSCTELLESECESQNGMFLGAGTICGPSTCGE